MILWDFGEKSSESLISGAASGRGARAGLPAGCHCPLVRGMPAAHLAPWRRLLRGYAGSSGIKGKGRIRWALQGERLSLMIGLSSSGWVTGPMCPVSTQRSLQSGRAPQSSSATRSAGRRLDLPAITVTGRASPR